MTGPAFEAFLARLYTDEQALARFLADPRGETVGARLADDEVAAVLTIDTASLRLAAQSLARKRASLPKPRRRRWWRWLAGFIAT